jgi:hypothetical protein
MRSVRRRRNESSTAAVMFAAERPGRVGSDPTFVAITMSSRLPRSAVHSPMIDSDSPPELPAMRHM